MSAYMIDSYGDCYRDFERRSCWRCREGVGSGKQSQEKPKSTQIDHEFVETKRRPTVIDVGKNRQARSSADGQTEALAVFASPNLPSILPMGAFPLTLVALGHVSRRSFDDMVK